MSIFAAFILALLISLLFAPGYRRGSYAPLVIFFFILFMAGIASQYWITPFGPVWYGISWMPILLIILIFTFLFAAPSPYERRRIANSNNDEKQAASAAAAAISIYVWLLFTILLIAIIVGALTKTAS
jgi:hypothetical protein